MHNENDLLRHVQFDGYTLKLYDTNRTDKMGKSILGYEMYTPKGELLFSGDDLHCSPMHAIDSDASLRALLGFLTLRPGDTDSEYFENYTPAQMEFAQGDAEELQLWGMEPEDDPEYPTPQFTNLDGWESE
jgi:hypothetical protein